MPVCVPNLLTWLGVGATLPITHTRNCTHMTLGLDGIVVRLLRYNHKILTPLMCAPDLQTWLGVDATHSVTQTNVLNNSDVQRCVQNYI